MVQSKHILRRSQALRKNMTKEERHLWYDFLKEYPVQFKRQVPFESYIVDFYCHQAKLVVELDGSQHYEKEAMDALKSSAGYIRREIGNGIRMHSTPEVKFEMDDSMAYGEKIQSIINTLDIKPLEDEESEDESDFE